MQQRILARPTTIPRTSIYGPPKGYRWIQGTTAYGKVTPPDRLYDVWANLRHPRTALRFRRNTGRWFIAW